MAEGAKSTVGLQLVISEAKFAGKLITLKNELDELNGKLASYRSLREKIDNVWSSKEAASYKDAIDNQINNIVETYRTVEEIFQKYGDLQTSFQSAVESVKQFSDDIKTKTNELFV